ncbi:MAG: type VII secretion protein EsaA [Culicoidibacterales bacterium]
MKKKAIFIIKIGVIFAITIGMSFFAFEKVYESMQRPQMKIALINEDSGAYFKSKKLSFGNAFVKQAERDKGYNWEIGARSMGESKLDNNEVDLLVIIPHDFSQKAVAFNEVDPKQLQLIYKINPKSNFLQLTQAETVLAELESGFNKSITEVYFASALQSIDNTKINVERIVQEQKAHEKIIVEDVNINLAKMTENFTTVKLEKQNDTTSLATLTQSLEDFNQRNITNKDSLIKYADDHGKFEAVYQKNSTSFASFMVRQEALNKQITAQDNQVKLSSMGASINGALDYFAGELGNSNAIIRLEKAKTDVNETIALLEANRKAIDTWLDKDEQGVSKLERDVRGIDDLVNLIKHFPEDNGEVKAAIELKITAFCRENLINTGLMAKNANHACQRLGYGDAGNFAASFTGTSYFAIDALDTAIILLSVNQKNSTFKDVSCATVQNFGQNFISKENSSVEAIACPNISNNGQSVSVNLPPKGDKQQLLALTYTIVAPMEVSSISVNQELLTEIPQLAAPTINVPDSGKNAVLSGTGVVGSTIVFENLRGASDVVVGPDGKWRTVINELREDQVITIRGQKLTPRYNGPDFMNRSDPTSIIVSANQAPVISRIKTGKNSRIEGFGTPGGTVLITLPNAIILSTTVDNLGQWRLIGPIELVKGQNISGYQTHQINGVAKKSPIVKTVVVETINPLINHIEAGPRPTISGVGEPGATVRIYRKELTTKGEEVLVEPPLAEVKIADLAAGISDQTMALPWSVDLRIPLEHDQKIVAIQTDLYANLAGSVERVVKDTIAPNLAEVVAITQNNISGRGQSGHKIKIEVNGKPLGTPVIVNAEGKFENRTLYNPTSADEITVTQVDVGGNNSGITKITLGEETYQKALAINEEEFIVGDAGVISGTTIAEGEIQVIINGIEKRALADESGKWSIDFKGSATIKLETVIKISKPKVVNSVKTTTAIEYWPKIKAAEPVSEKVAATLAVEQTPKYYIQSAKTLKLDNLNAIKVETAPAVLEQYFMLYYGYGITQINSDFPNKTAIEEKATDASLYKKLNSEGASIDAISQAFSTFNVAITASFDQFRVQTQKALDLLDGPECSLDGVCLTGINDIIATEIEGIKGQGEKLKQLKQEHEAFVKTFTAVQAESDGATKQLNQLAVDKEQQTPLLLEVTNFHQKMLEQGSSLQESAAKQHQTVADMKTSAEDFANVTIEMSEKSTEYLQHLQKVTTKLQEDVEGSGNFANNLGTVFANSKVNGVENDNLYDFMSNPVKKENFSEKSFRGITLFPYFTTIISFSLSLMLAYTFLNWKQRVAMVYADEYTWDVLVSNTKKSGLLFAIATLVGVIVGLVSAFMAGLLSWQLLAWVIALALIINAFTHAMYFCLRQFKSFGLFLILCVLLVYLLSSQAMGVYLMKGTLLAKILEVFPLAHIESLLASILYGSSLNGQMFVIFSVILALVGAITLSLLVGLYESKVEVAKNA